MSDLQTRPELNLTHGQSPILQTRAIVAIYENEIDSDDFSKDGVSSAQCDAARNQEEMLRLSKLIAALAIKGNKSSAAVTDSD